MVYTEFITNWQEAVAGGAASAAVVTLGFIAILLGIAIYVYHALAWMTIAKRLKHKYPWLAWIPFASSAMRLQLGKFHWAWIFLVLIPILGWIALIVLITIATWRIFEKRKHSGWLSLAFTAMFLPRISGIGTIVYLIALGSVAWRKK